MRGLGGRVNNQIRTQFPNQLQDDLTISDIAVIRGKVFRRLQKMIESRLCVTVGTKKFAAHIIVYAMHFPATVFKIENRFRSHQSATTGHKNFFHRSFLGSPALVHQPPSFNPIIPFPVTQFEPDQSGPPTRPNAPTRQVPPNPPPTEPWVGNPAASWPY